MTKLIFRSETFNAIASDCRNKRSPIVKDRILKAQTFNMLVTDIYKENKLTRSSIYRLIEEFESALCDLMNSSEKLFMTDVFDLIEEFENMISKIA